MIYNSNLTEGLNNNKVFAGLFSKKCKFAIGKGVALYFHFGNISKKLDVATPEV